MKKTILLILVFVSLGFSNGLFSVSKKRVLVMTFKNIERNDDYNYLEPSITESVIKKLQENFVFTLFNEKDWKLLAKKNFFFEDSYHTPTIGMQLGLLGKQDVVIGGGYIIRGNRIITKVHILGIAKREILKDFEIVGYADSRIWDSVKDIANRIAEIANNVLPNESDWSSIALSGKNQLSLVAGVTPIGLPAPITVLPSATPFSVNPTDFPLILAFSADYSYFGLLNDNFLVWGNFTYGFGSHEFEAEGHDPSLSTVGGTISIFHPSFGVGYRVLSIKSFYITPRMGVGYYIGALVLDFSKLTNPPSALGGTKDLSSVESSLAGISLNFDLLIGYQVFQWLTFEIKTQYQQVFFNDSDFGQFTFALVSGFKF